MIKKFHIEPPILITRHAGESRHPRLAGRASNDEVGMTEVSKRFFFEKKKQKTFANWAMGVAASTAEDRKQRHTSWPGLTGPSTPSPRRPQPPRFCLNLATGRLTSTAKDQKFFASFFQKRSASFPYFAHFI
jgi:hypothetical protein